MPWNDTRPWLKDPATRFKTPLDQAILARLHDAHCHPSDDEHFQADTLREVKTGHLCTMSSSLQNQQVAEDVFEARRESVTPFFGLHPWFCHAISFEPPDRLPTKEAHYTSIFPSSPDSSDPHPSLALLLPTLPDPVSIDIFVSELSFRLERFPTSQVGEIGLDKAFRIPNPPHIAADKSNPRHSDLATPIAHQIRIVDAQVDVAIRYGRNISLHSVRTPQETVDMLKRFKEEKGEGWTKLHVCLHSFGGSPESAKQIQKAHPNTFFSFATIISGRSPSFHSLLRAIEPHRLLIESDFSSTIEIDYQASLRLCTRPAPQQS
ncbi:Cut9-interacting protein scn1 [Rhodotorula sphaerocarpa]